MAVSTEERLASLEKTLSTLAHEVERLKTIEECQHLMGRYMAIHTPAEQKNAWKLYANRPDSSHESFNGYFFGIDAVRRYLEGECEKFSLQLEGSFFEHDLCTPTIAVADDLQTARGVWFSPGCECFGGEGKDGAPKPVWCWSKYAVDFIKEGDEWKIWHTHFYCTFMTPYDTPWTESGMSQLGGGAGLSDPGAKSNIYDPKGIYKAIPEAPMPYATFTPDMMRP